MYTEVFQNPSFRSMRALVASMLDRLEFRHHGIGVLQGYVQEDVEPEVRIHIWSPRLVKPGIDVSGDVHDHRFDMVSHVLQGVVRHEVWIETPNPAGKYAMMALTHARAAAATNYHGPTAAVDGCFDVTKSGYSVPEGWSYSFSAGRFHRSPVDGGCPLAVTCVEKHRQRPDVQARLLYRAETPPVMAFGHRIDQGLVRELVAEAKEALSHYP